AGIPTWSPTVVLICRSTAYVWQSGRDAQFSADCGLIGSGYGGGVAASRMARAQPKQSVCVLERGLERWPGEYPKSLWDVLQQVRVTGHISFGPIKDLYIGIGRITSLYQWIIGKGSNAFVANGKFVSLNFNDFRTNAPGGLGGTSLVNANVFLRPDSRVLESPKFPSQLRQHAVLDPYFRRAMAMLEPTKSRKVFPKDDVFRRQAIHVGLGDCFMSVDQTVTFEDKYNATGVPMEASTFSGQDIQGINDHSKNHVLATYLADAWSFGAELYCGCDVRYIKKHPEAGYLVYFREASQSLLRYPSKKFRWVHARKLVFLGAGSIGSTEIVLRSREYGLPTSQAVGTSLSGNGSMVAFGHNLNKHVNAVGKVTPDRDPSGNTIGSMIDCRGSEDVDQGFILQTGTFPASLASILGVWFGKALSWSQVYLVVGHDQNNGSISLVKDRPMLNMRGVEKTSCLCRIKEILVQMTRAMGGMFKEHSLKVTVHPLGGLGFAGDGTGCTGSTSHTGELFSGEDTEVHVGLCAVDGSVLPRSLGANPLATITAIAERSVETMATRQGLSMDLKSQAHFDLRYHKHLREIKTKIHFDEKMEGSLSYNGKDVSLSIALHVEVHQQDDVFEGKLFGTVDCRALSPQSLNIKEGCFRLFEADPSEPNLMTMTYDFVAISCSGQKFAITGRKYFDPSIAFSVAELWRAATTLFVAVKLEDGSPLASGKVNISLSSFISQLQSMTASGESALGEYEIFTRFLYFFTRKLLKVFFAPLAPLQYPEDTDAVCGGPVDCKTDPTLLKKIVASDGIQSTLRMWTPSQNRLSRLPIRDILFIPGAAVTYQIFASPWVAENAIERFVRQGYRCWCLTTRFGKEGIDDTEAGWTAYDARLDIAAALLEIETWHHQSQSKTHTPPYVIAHCVGSLALASALLDGTVLNTSIAGITASQIFLHPTLEPLNHWKARLRLNNLYRLLAGNWFPCTTTRTADPIQRALNFILRFYPQFNKRELCDSIVCHRCNLVFGRLWNHANLNAATHTYLHAVFGGVHTRCIQHLATSGQRRAVLDNDYHSLVTDKNLRRLRGIPMLVFGGADNNVYSPESTRETCRVLEQRGEAVRMKVFEGLGHLDCWMSERAASKGGVYDTVVEEVRRVMHG
ncbi:hypothetical protein KCU79_g7562, partial [Aureobasidium melanogenum]